MMSSGGISELLELSRHLKQERLFVSAEKEQLHTLHTTIGAKSQRLYHLTWIARQQKNELDRLILADRNTTPAACCQRVNTFEMVTFMDGYRQLTYHESKIGRFLKLFREIPKLVATCLMLAEKQSIETMQSVAGIMMSGLYGNVVLPEDEAYVVQILKHLIDLQVSQSDDPRRLLRKGSCAFSTIFKLLNEGHFSARLFLTAALHKPVMQLLMEDEWFYDIDPDRALHRFPPHERLRRFGQPGSDDYEQKIQRYRDVTTDKLVALVNHFVMNLQANMYCFPPSLAWIISQLYHTLVKAETVDRAEARAICADLVLTFFICPAICDPEPYGITTDAPISYIARHNLIQVGQIMQVLAISKPEEIDNKTRDLYSKFPPGFMSFLLDALLDAPLVSAPAPSQSNLSGFSRSAALLSCSELLELIGFLHNVAVGLKEDSGEKRQLEDLLTTCNLPSQSVIHALCSSSSSASHSAHNSPNSTPQATPPGTPVSMKKLSKVKDKKKLFLSPPGTNDNEEVDSIQFAEDVLVISFGMVNECPGLLSEQKVLEQEVRQKKVKYNSLLPGEDDPVSESEVLVHEKRTRFSLSHDQDSIATSDNLEAISEAASSHSVTSDLDNENDNLSDMMSANVSGRGTPNVSGRDTPISQADSQMEGPEERQPMVPDLPVIVQKTNREDVTDRFGKFEIKHEIERDETKSTVSDTWSTDVLASDSEPPEQNQLERLEEVAEEPANNVLGVQEVVMEISETASDAWSTDVLASDTSERQADRLLELDQDDVASVSSRGVGPGSEIGELETTGDNTPQASGNQSPHDSPFEPAGDTDSGTRSPKVALRLTKAAVASANNQPSQTSSNRNYNPSSSSSEQSIFRMNRYISDEGDRQVASVRLPEFLVTGRRGKPIHSPVPLKLVPDSCPTVPQERSRSEDLDRDGEANSVFSSDDLVLNDAEGSDKDHRSPISKASSDACLNCLDSAPSALDLSFHSSSSVGSLVDFSDRGHGDPGVNSTTTMGSSVSVDTLTNEFSDGLKLTEHQNEKLDERRLSSVSSCFFDPLMEDGSVTTRQTASTGDLPQCKGVGCAEQGARPKTSSGCYPAPPKISVSQTGTQQSKVKGVLGVSNGKAQAPAPKGARGENDHVSDAGMVSFEGVTSKTADSAAGAFGSPMAAPRAAAKPLSISLATQVGSEMSPGASANKEDDDKKQDKHDKRKPGFFNAFRERLTRGSFPVPVQVPRGTKRKVSTKPADEVFRPSVVIDSDKGVDATVKVPTSSTTETTADETTTRPKSSGATGTKTEDLATVTDTSDEILAKYRSKPAPVPKPSDSSTASSLPSSAGGSSRPVEEEEGPPAYDPNNLETCKAFLDAKKKLRLVLSNADFQGSVHGYQYSGSISRNPLAEPKESELVAFLKLQLAEAINLQDKDLIAQLHETIRCLRQFDSQETKKLLKTMREEYRCRSPYVAYLVRCRQGLLTSLALIERLLVRVERNKAVMNKYLLSVFVRLFLEKKEKALMKFISEFQKLTVSDEKTDLVENFLAFLHREMEEDPLWQVASASQLDEAKLYVERNVMSHIYTHAMFPNGDGDILRDQILTEHIKNLSKVITPTHKDLRIPKVYHYECPWPAAQTEIYMINAYKTPKDKLQCILRCSSTIMNLLSMANEKSVPAADDFMPVLIYILIKANAPSLLSTVQYIKSFYEKRLSGEEQYWWMQFASAIEFIKTMDYTE